MPVKPKINTGGVSHCGLAIYVKLTKRRNYENSNISPCKKYNLQKNPLKETKNLSRYHNESQVSTHGKIPSFNNPHIKIDLLLRGQNP